MKLSKKFMIVCCAFSVLALGGCGKDEKEETPKEKIKIVENSVYETPKKPTEEMKKVYNQLSKALDGSDDAKKAELVGVNFAYQFFTLSNKTGNEDVGGLTFIPEASREEFKQYAVSYYYGNYKTVVNQHGKDSLPYVKSHKVTGVEATQLIYNDQTYDGYFVKLKLTYKSSELKEKQLKTTMTLQVIPDDNGVWRVIAAE